jgi:hypothetical protein
MHVGGMICRHQERFCCRKGHAVRPCPTLLRQHVAPTLVAHILEALLAPDVCAFGRVYRLRFDPSWNRPPQNKKPPSKLDGFVLASRGSE